MAIRNSASHKDVRSETADGSYYAHIRNGNGTAVRQTVDEHCRNTAETASELLRPVGIGNAAYIAGYLHDMGKCKKEYQDYLMKSFRGENTVRGSVVHTFAGVRYVLDHYHTGMPDTTKIIAEIIAYAIGAHHGLFDINAEKANGFIHRIMSADTGYEESKEGFLRSCMNPGQIDAFMKTAEDELWALISEKILYLSQKENEEEANAETAFYMGMLERLLLSSVIEGDRRDTASFMSGKQYTAKEADWSKYLAGMEEKLNRFPNERKIDRAKTEISDRCRKYADNPGGVITLNAPTGSGKTLTSLRYALAHAAKYHKRRIIFVIPLLSILEQNADEIRKWIGDDSVILEHHSNVVSDNGNSEDSGTREALTESWESPVIITTLVQLMNTLFSGKTSCIRRFHALAHSVIVIDEVQTVPLKMLSLFNLALNFLTEICGATAVLCSATQPELTDTHQEHPLLSEPKEMIPFDRELWTAFKRTEITDAGDMTLEKIQDFGIKLVKKSKSLLIICNKKIEAYHIYKGLTKKGCKAYHLSAAMCTEHRRRVLNEIKTELKNADAGHPVICVATQVMEAGVDVSFGTVIRILAGMDSIVQAVGRCNRYAENGEIAKVYIVRLRGEGLSKLPDIQRGKNASLSLLYEFKKDPGRYDNDLSSAPAIKEYYRNYYRELPAGATLFPVPESECSIYDLLALNRKYCSDDHGYYYRQAFKTAGEHFAVFDDDSTDAIAPYGEGKEIIQRLSELGRDDFAEAKTLIKKASQYSVTVYDYQRQELEKTGGLRMILNGSVAVLGDKYYDPETGFTV